MTILAPDWLRIETDIISALAAGHAKRGLAANSLNPKEGFVCAPASPGAGVRACILCPCCLQQGG